MSLKRLLDFEQDFGLCVVWTQFSVIQNRIKFTLK